MTAPTVYTSANLGYLDRALVLLDSLRLHEPTWTVVLVLVDEHPRDRAARDLLELFDDVILAKDLPIEDFDRWIFGHDVVEACTAVKGDALQVLLDTGAPYVVYLDPDTACFGPLRSVTESMESASILLTPHQLDKELEQWAVRDNEITSLKTGTFNFGFLGVKNDEVGRAFTSWWSARLADFCVDDVAGGLFTDQRWGDLVPALFDNAIILRDRGVNVASWNILNRRLRFEASGSICAGDDPLSLYHFTKAEGVGALMTLKHSRGALEVAAVWRWYLERLTHYSRQVGPRSWAYSEFDDGTAIATWHRRLYRSRRDLQAAYPDPYATSGGPGLLGWLRQYEVEEAL